MENRAIAGAEKSLVHQELQKWWGTLVSNRIRVLVWVLAGFSVGVALFLLSPKKYSAEATLISVSNSGPSSSLLSQAQFLTGMAFGQADLAQVYPTICKSRNILDKVLAKEMENGKLADELVAAWELDKGKSQDRIHAELIEILREVTTVSYRAPESLVSIKVVQKNPELAALLANSIVDELDFFLDGLKAEETGLQSRALEIRLVEVADSLSIAESALLEFRLHNKNIAQAPALKLEEGRLMRRVQIFGQVYGELNRQYEVLKINMLDDSNRFNILDRAIPPLVPASPKLLKLVVYFVVVGFALAILDLQLIIWGERKRLKPLISLLTGRS